MNTKQKILFLHSAGHQHNEEGSARLLKFIKDKLSANFEIIAPIMPHPDEPDYNSWKMVLTEVFKIMDDDIILIGHSLGGSVLLKFLSEEQPSQHIKALYLVAVPFWGLDDWEIEEFTLVDDFAERLPSIDAITIYHSRDDQTVSSKHGERYASELPMSVYHELNGYGHVYWDGLPEMTKSIQEYSR
ncbi:MAG: serine hydrolase family protein [Chitinophagaceae bacterium]|nr:MAG: serine hydrolase family protein [Chitinophagaceae bacterium]